MLYLRQSTASQEVCLGPFVDQTDGSTAETGLTINSANIVIWKEGATSTTTKNAAGGATHMAGGLYYSVFDATDTNTLGSLVVMVNVSGALPVRHEFIVLSANVYDSLIPGTDILDVSVTQISGSAVSTSTAQLGVNVVNFGGSAGTFASGIPSVNAAQISGDATAADNAESFFDGTGYAGTNNVIPTVTTVTNAVSANVTQISGDTTAADNAESFFDGTGYAGTNNVIPTVTTVNGLAADTLTASALATDAVTEIVNAIKAITGTDPTEPPAPEGTWLALLSWVAAQFLNAKTCNRTTGETFIYDNDGTSDGGVVVGSMIVADDGQTASFTAWE